MEKLEARAFRLAEIAGGEFPALLKTIFD